MNNLLEVKFEQFKDDFELKGQSSESCWIRYVNYQFFSQFQPGRLDTDSDLLEMICVNSSKYSKIQGVLLLLNDQILCEKKDIDDILQREKKGILELYFLTFDANGGVVQQVENLLENIETISTDEKWIEILSYAMSQKIMLKWRDNPVLNFVIYNDEQKKIQPLSEDVRKCFSDVYYTEIDRKALFDIVKANENSYEVELDCNSYLTVSTGKEKIANMFITSVTGLELIKLITTSDGALRRNIFDDNVRDSQGFSAVNQEIFSTIKEFPSRFILYNNGITIVCKKASINYGKAVLVDPQIVNGCQTCSMIYQAYRKQINLNEVQVIAKVVGANEDDVTQGIVRGANRQNIVYEEAFETIKSFHKGLENYFEINKVSGYEKIYYERRSRQYADNIQIKPRQKISFRSLIQSMVALFLNHVEDSHRHEYTLLKKYGELLFLDTHEYLPYYLAGFLYLMVDSLFKEHKLPKSLNGYKMHIMLLIKEMQGGTSPDLSSEDVVLYCEHLLQTLENGKIEKCALDACEKFNEITKNWIAIKGDQYKYGIKDNAEFRSFLIKEIRGTVSEEDVNITYTGYVLNVDLDKHNTLYGFIEREPENIFFHEFDNSNIDRSYIGKKVSYKIARNAGQERAIDVKLIDV